MRTTLPSLVGALAWLAVATALAQDRPMTFNLPAQPLASALKALSREANLQMFYAAEAVRDKTTSGLTGTYTPRQAVQRLLADTGLAYTFTAENAVAIRTAEAEASPEGATPRPKPEPEAQVDELPAMTVTASPLDETRYNVFDATTATKTDTPIMETPASIQVVPQQVLKDQQAFRLGQALRNVSGVRTSSNQGTHEDFVLRGFTAGAVTGASYLRNGARIGSNEGTQGLANVERVEVLKGPASILYGRLEPGGIINVVTKQPTAEPYYALEQQFGSYDFYRTHVDTGGP